MAFDVYDHVCGGYLYRLGVGLFAQRHLIHFVRKVAGYMLASDPEALSEYGGLEGRRMRQRMQQQALRRGLLPLLLPTYLPWYTPEKIEFTAEMAALARQYSERAAATS